MFPEPLVELKVTAFKRSYFTVQHIYLKLEIALLGLLTTSTATVITFSFSKVCPLLFLLVDCECNWPSFCATVFRSAYAFNGNLNQWDVAKVTDMYKS
jgi:hypothetical protein